MQVFRRDEVRKSDGGEIESHMSSSDRNALAKAALAKENLQLRARVKELEAEISKLRNKMIARGVKDGLAKRDATQPIDTASAITKQRQRYLSQ